MIEYKLIRELEQNPLHTQRSLAEKLNISLGKANYLLAGFVEKGIIKAKRLKNHPEKIRWQYILTAKGLKEKVRITRNYFNRRLKEFDKIKVEISELRQEIDGLKTKVRHIELG